MPLNAPSRHRIRFLDHMRGIAILIVFCVHALYATFHFDYLKWKGLFRDFHTSTSFLILSPLSLGVFGVSIFFVISGFCIHLSHQQSKQKEWKVYFTRRFFRIYPPYLLAALFFAFIFPITRLAFDSAQDASQLGSHFFLIHNFGRATYYGINGVFWSIAVEVQLYLLYPLLLLLIKRLGWTKVLVLTALIELGLRSMVAVAGLKHDEALPRLLLLSGPLYYWFCWTIGAKVADDMLNGRSIFLARWPAWFWPAVAVISYLFKPLSEFTFLFAALATGNVIARALTHPHRTRWLVPNFISGHMQFVGLVSYSMYLFHQPLLSIVHWVFSNPLADHFVHPLIRFATCLATYPFILFVSWLAYRVIELPSIDLGKKLLRTDLLGTSAPGGLQDPRSP